ncbi:MAG: hypothetical protein ACSHX0_05245 [Akkermansiaceae bacterium]
MALHAQLSNVALSAIKRQNRKNTITSVIISVLVITLICIVLFFFLLPPVNNYDPEIVSYQIPAEEARNDDQRKVTRSIKENPTPPAASSAINRLITSNNMFSVAVPTSEEYVVEDTVDFGDDISLDTSWGSGFGGDGNLFGATGSNGLVGRFYDLKQNQDRETNQVGEYFNKGLKLPARIRYMIPLIKKMAASKFSDRSLSDYYRAKRELIFTNLVMGVQPASIAPEAFDVEKEVKPTCWLVKYEGEITPPEEGYYRFVGIYDDFVIVFINGKIVLDGSFNAFGAYTDKYDDGESLPGAKINGKLLRAGKYVNLKAGDKIVIVAGEVPGGMLGGGLFIQKKDKKYLLNPGGGPILPPFTTVRLSEKAKSRLRDFPYRIEVNDVPVFTANRN